MYGQPIAKIDSSGVQYIHNDHLGTPMIMTNINGAKVWEIQTKPFGDGAKVWEIQTKPFGDGATITGTATLNLRFPGQYFDEETGLNYNGFRDYKPMTGRYIQADPIGLLGGVNVYNYSLNNPTLFTDPDGLFAWEIPFTDTYFYFEKKTAPDSKGVNTGFVTRNALEKKYGKLNELAPDMKGKAEKVLIRMEAMGYTPTIVEALRTKEQQKEKLNKGFSKTLKSKHLDQSGKGSCAMDVVDKKWGYDDSTKKAQQFFKEYGEVGIDEGLSWGGSWKPINQKKGYGWDPGHLQLD